MINDIIKNVENIVLPFKLGEYVNIKKWDEKKPYSDVKSNKQISTLVNNSGYKYYYRLCELIGKHIKIKKGFQDYIHNLLNNNHPDDVIYAKIKKHLDDKKIKLNGGSIRDEMRADYMYSKYKNHKLDNTSKYLDIGCGNGQISKLLGKKFGLTEQNIYCIELNKWITDEKKDFADINVQLSDDFSHLPYGDGEFDIISAFMVLHHVKKLDIMLREVSRCLRKGGLFIIREHDALTKNDYMMIDIEHALYDICKSGISYNDFVNNYYGKYHDWLELDYLVCNNNNMEYIDGQYDNLSIVWDVEPTRYYYTIYRRN